jgi:hypothetical protein
MHFATIPVIPAKAGISVSFTKTQMPACAGMTIWL